MDLGEGLRCDVVGQSWAHRAASWRHEVRLAAVFYALLIQHLLSCFEFITTIIIMGFLSPFLVVMDFSFH